MFDLPVLTAHQRREYRTFRKFLVENGFVMMQESIYTKIAINGSAADAVIQSVRKNKPSEGNVALLKITEKQYSKIEYIVGQAQTEVVDSDERIVVV